MSLPRELQPLCRELDRERPNVLVVVGAGVSVGATGEQRASWRGLLEHGVAVLRRKGAWDAETADANLTLIRRAFSSTFDLDEVLARAESIAKALGAPDGPDYRSWLAGAIGTLAAQPGRTATLEAIGRLERAGALILTTNYDDLLGVAIGREPVTWQDHQQLLRVLNRDADGILHIHGHWRQPSSVILGRESYQRILDATALQDVFKSIWLHWSWLYVGCGNGLDDPNVGRLLRWGHAVFGGSARKDYFLALEADAAALAARADKPANLVPVAYRDHAELPHHLEALTPRRRASPFVELGAESGPVRHPRISPLDIPLPSWQELLAGEVPALAADAAVLAALRTHGWALVYDVASVGKTTLALRLAAGAEYRDGPAFYLDLARVGAGDEEELARVQGAVRRLAHAKSLIILDNAHRAPELARACWDGWLERPRRSHLLLLATRIQHTAGIAGDDALATVERHPRNPSIAVRPAMADLPPILNHIVTRIRGAGAAVSPPDDALERWHADFACELGAFAAAVTECHHRLVEGQWDLPLSAAAEWMRNRHLRDLTTEERENLVCLSVIAALELDVAEDGLPHPDRVAALLRRGLVERHERGRERYRSYALREPDWGALLLAAVDPRPDREDVLLGTACRSAVMALAVSSRLFSRNDTALLAKLWRRIDEPGTLARVFGQLVSMSLSFTLLFRAHAASHGRADLGDRLLHALEVNANRLAERVFETPLHSVAPFIEVAAGQRRATLVTRLWEGLEAAPDRLAERALETPLADLASFIEAASFHRRTTLVGRLWKALEANPVRLAERAFETPLHGVVSFLETATGHERGTLVKRLWDDLEADSARLAERAFEAPLGTVASFIETATERERDTLVERLWVALEADPARLAGRAFETRLQGVASFMETATGQKRATLVKRLWDELEADPARLAERAFEAPLGTLASFIETAAEQKREVLVKRLWDALEANPARLAERVFETPLQNAALFIETATGQNRATLAERLWEVLEANPARLAERASETPLQELASLIETATGQKRDTLVERLWEALERDPARLAERAFETPLQDLASFIETATERERDTLVERLWEVLERDPARLAKRVFETPLASLAFFIETATGQNRTTLVERIWDAVEKDPEWLQAAVASADGANLRGFLKRAPEAIGRIAIARLEIANWASDHHGFVSWGAPRLATQLAALGRDDLAAGLRRHLLRSADPRHFAAPYAALLDVAILLSNVPGTELDQVEAFVGTICTPTWLARQYATTTYDGPLAEALVSLALSQPPAILRRFWSRALTSRVAIALAGLSTAEGDALSGFVQLLGAAQLIGRRMPRPLRGARLEVIARLPIDVVPHRPEVDGIESHQRNLWLGLRAVASLTAAPPPVGRAVLDETLRRWRVNLLARAGAESEGTGHRLDRSMIAWLQACACDGDGVLLRGREPLWLVTGFGRDPRIA